ncbi:MAG: glutaminase A [Fusobacteriaceae bacterium]
MEKYLETVINYHKYQTLHGSVANYIPGLSKANREHLGICLINDDGCFSAGDTEVKFTIQSVSKPLSLMLAILDNGIEYVFSKVGMEPTGDAFNSIVKLETATTMKKPFNPMINAGAIEICSMIKGETAEVRFARILDFFRKISENPCLDINQEIYEGEKLTGNRNRAMGYLLKAEGLIEGDVEDALDIYFKQCSIEVTATDLAKFSMFLARNGITSNGERVVSEHVCKIIKTLMVTCGMYDGSGEYAVKVGIPSKSGVGGGIMAVVPGKMGIGVFGPSLDTKGNSIAGISVLADLASRLDLSIF